MHFLLVLLITQGTINNVKPVNQNRRRIAAGNKNEQKKPKKGRCQMRKVKVPHWPLQEEENVVGKFPKFPHTSSGFSSTPEDLFDFAFCFFAGCQLKNFRLFFGLILAQAKV